MIRTIVRPAWLKAGIRHRAKGYGAMTIYGADTETVKGKPYTIQVAGKGFGVVVRVAQKTVTGKFLDILDGLPSPATIFLHNLEFDLPVLFFPFLPAFEQSSFTLEHSLWRAEILYGKINTAKIFLLNKYRPRVFTLVDTFAFFKQSLKSLAKTFSLPEKMEPPRNIGEKKYHGGEWRYFKAYALRDAETAYALGNVISGFHESEDIPQAISAPQMAAFIFRKKFVPRDRSIPANPPDVDEAACLSYHGGKNGLYLEPGMYPNVALYDINSAYPYAMTRLPNPIDATYSWKKGTREGMRSGVLGTVDFPAYFQQVAQGKRNLTPGVYLVTGFSHTKTYNPLRSHDFKPIFGAIKPTWVTSYELETALRHGYISSPECREAFTFEYSHPQVNSPLRRYAETYFELKSTAQGNLREFYKILLNSLYGKFIQNRSDNEILPLYKKTEPAFKAGGLWNPMIATLITGYVRAHLTELEIRFLSCHSSTDSILVPAGQSVPTSRDLGALSLKAKGTALLLRPKLYLLWNDDAEIVSFALHGFHGTLKQFVSMMRSEGREYVHRRMMKVREAMRQHATPLVMREFRKRVNLATLPVRIPPLTYRGEKL